MPAVQLARLKIQIDDLASVFTRPVVFQKKLADLLDFYANRAYRPGQAVRTKTLLPTYHVAPLIIRYMEQAFSRLCQEQPAAALELIDCLWQDTYLEPRLLAAALLGSIALTPPEPVLERLRSWANPDQDAQLLTALLQQGSANVRKKLPDLWLEIVEQWLSESGLASRSLGLVALLPVVQDQSYQNLPRVFRLLAPVMQSAQPDLQADLQVNLEALAQRSPAETAYFLRQMMNIAPSTTIVRLVRRLLPVFSEEQQTGLRKALVNRAAKP